MQDRYGNWTFTTFLSKLSQFRGRYSVSVKYEGMDVCISSAPRRSPADALAVAKEDFVMYAKISHAITVIEGVLGRNVELPDFGSIDPVYCASCGALINMARAAYCPSCGTKLSEVSPVSEGDDISVDDIQGISAHCDDA